MKTKNTIFLGMLALILAGLKLAGVGVVAGWSWWAVLAPLWVPWVVLVAVVAVMWVAGLVLQRMGR